MRRLNYDKAEFHRYNWMLRRSIIEYDREPKRYPHSLRSLTPENVKWPSRRFTSDGVKLCGRENCLVEVPSPRLILCPEHREESRQLTKHHKKP